MGQSSPANQKVTIMAATVFTGWRNVTPGPCNVCGSTDDYDCDGRGNVYCSCQCCAACGAFDGHEVGCSEASDDDDEPECMGHDSAGEPGGCDLPYPRTVYCDGSCRRA